MKTKMLAMIGLFAMAPLAGCATMTGGSTRFVRIDSEPAGAEISIVNWSTGETVFAGTTPIVATLKPGDGYFHGADYTVTFKKAGYASMEKNIRRGVNGWYIGGNILLGGLIGWLIVDPLSGAMWTLDGNCSVELSPLPSSSATDVDGLHIVCLDNVPDHLRQHLHPVN
jgi:hypothetical protein